MGDVYKALSDPTRREILRILHDGEKSAGELADHFKLSKPTLSGHFNILKESDLVLSEKKGTTVIYSLNVSVFEETIGMILDFFKVGLKNKTIENNEGFQVEN